MEEEEEEEEDDENAFYAPAVRALAEQVSHAPMPPMCPPCSRRHAVQLDVPSGDASLWPCVWCCALGGCSQEGAPGGITGAWGCRNGK